MTLLVVAIASPTAKIVHIDQRPYLFVLHNFCSAAIYQRDHLIVVYPIMVTPPLPPPPPPHIVAMGDDILRDLDDQQQKMDELFSDRWPESFLAAERTSRQLRRSRTPGNVNPPSHQSTSILFDNQSSSIKIPARRSPTPNLSPGGLAVNSTPTLRRSPTPNLSPGGLAVNSTPTLRCSPRVDAKSIYAMMMSRQHKAIIQIKQEKKKQSYPSSIVPKVRSAECDRPPLFFNKHSNHRTAPNCATAA